MYEIFEKLCREHRITPYRVCKETGLTTSTVSNWKAGRYTPKADKMQKIADYFGVTVEYLMTGREKPEKEEIMLSPKDERDISKELESLKEKLESNDCNSLLYYDMTLDEKHLELLKTAIEIALSDVKKHKVKQFPKKTHLEPQAAHERTDIEVTDDMKKHDDDIMDDDAFWNK